MCMVMSFCGKHMSVCMVVASNKSNETIYMYIHVCICMYTYTDVYTYIYVYTPAHPSRPF